LWIYSLEFKQRATTGFHSPSECLPWIRYYSKAPEGLQGRDSWGLSK